MDQGDHLQGGSQPYPARPPGMPDVAGPPPPPWERRRRTRRRVLLVALVGLVLLAVPVAILLATDPFGRGEDVPVVAPPSDDPGDPEAGEPAPDDPAEPLPDVDAPPEDDDLPVPDLAELEGDDAVLGRLLVDIDASERAMIAFQDELQAAFEEHGGDLDPSELIDRIRQAAGEGADRLAVVRSRIADPVEVEAAEAVRVVYVEHLDAWATYMSAVEDDPGVLGTEEDRSRYILAINTSAGTFARTLEEGLPADVDPVVERFAEGILDRGFRIDFEPDA